MLIQARVDPKILSKIEAKYGSGLRVALETLTPSQIDFISKMPHRVSLEIQGFKILLCHGSPINEVSYLYPDAAENIILQFRSFPEDIIVMGHTHYPMNLRVKDVRLVNPGSVGQPRTPRKGASWAFLDTETGDITHRSEMYECAPLVMECKNRHPDIPYLANILLET